mgnify:CR=1 FL=1|tara:strand:+ start:94 stop:567 length:474 start_codon:yes stop_codon:yes gene_type:complete
MTDTYTLATLSKMTMVEIMNNLNHYRELSISNHNDKMELILKNEHAFAKHMKEKKQLKSKYIKEITELKNKKYIQDIIPKISSKGLVKTKKLLQTQKELMFLRAQQMANDLFVYEHSEPEYIVETFNLFFDREDKAYYKEMYEYFKIDKIIEESKND